MMKETTKVTAAPEVHALACPRCGGSLETRESAALVRCDYCGGAFTAQAPDGTFRYIAPARITREDAEDAVRELFRDPARPPDLASESTRDSCELLYVPFWRFHATFVGRVSGKRDIFSRRPVRTWHGDEEGGVTTVLQVENVRVGEESVVEEIQEIWKATVTACPVEDLGVPRLSSRRQMVGGLARLAAGAGELPGLTLVSEAPVGGGVLIDPMIPASDARREAEQIFDRFAKGRGAELRERELVYERMQERVNLVFYPIYRVRFQYRGRLFEATVDGLERRLIRAVLPGRSQTDLLAYFAIASGFGFATGGLLRSLLHPSADAASLFSATERGTFVILGLGLLAAFGLVFRTLTARFAPEGDDVVITP